MKNLKRFILLFLCSAFLIAPVQAKSKMEKIQKGLDTYFMVTGMLDLSLNQQRKAFSLKMKEMKKLAPLIEEIKINEEKLSQLSGKEKQEMLETIKMQKLEAKQLKRHYIAKYRGILSEEQNILLDELIFDVANGYIKL